MYPIVSHQTISIVRLVVALMITAALKVTGWNLVIFTFFLLQMGCFLRLMLILWSFLSWLVKVCKKILWRLVFIVLKHELQGIEPKYVVPDELSRLYS